MHYSTALNFVLVFLMFGAVFLATPHVAYALPANFQDTAVWSGFNLPATVRFSPDGKVFVSEKGGIIKVFDNLQDTTPTIFADLSAEVQDYDDRGLSGLVVDPQFPTRPYVYAFYPVDAPPGGTPPFYNDNCPTEDNCLAFARLSKLTATGSVMSEKQTIMDGWCQMSAHHSADDLTFGNDGYLYVSHGEGGTASYVDYGQDGGCGDPPNEGGALHAQDIRSTGDPVTYAGSIIRIDPDTGMAAPGNPLIGNAVPDDDPIIATGLRNPFRMNFDRVTGRLWIGDVGWSTWEEVSSIASTTDSLVENFGWPCYEGFGRQSGYDSANLPLCESLYTEGSATPPFYDYLHNGTSAISGILPYRGSNFPAQYDGALFFADYAQGWIKVMTQGGSGLPDPATITNFIPSGAAAVDLQMGPNGEMFYADIMRGQVRMVKYYPTNSPPVAVLNASPTFGSLPLTVNFNAASSSDPDAGDTLSYSWDLNGDGQFDDATSSAPAYTYTIAGMITAQLRVSDSQTASSTASIVLHPGNTPPMPVILSPATSTLFKAGDIISFSGAATDAESGALADSGLGWQVVLRHCAVSNPSDCHSHFTNQFTATSSASIEMPDHEYPAFVQLTLTATDPEGLSASVTQDIYPQTTTLSLNSIPSGLQLNVYGTSQTTPFTRTVMVNAQTSISAPTPQLLDSLNYAFSSWSDGGAQTHLVTATDSPQTFIATFEQSMTPNIWNSWGVVTQAGSPQGVVTSSTGVAAIIEFYESTNNFGITKGSLFPTFNSGTHPDAFNKAENYWTNNSSGPGYPYTAKSTVNRGSDVGESGAQTPLGVFDLMLHPPQNDHNTVAAFKAPQDGTYTISGLGVRRVDSNGTSVRYRIFNPQGTELALLNATNNHAWVTTATSYTVTNATVGQYIYFGVDRNGDYDSDATEISWTITQTPSGPVPPNCSLSANPLSIFEGDASALSWTSTNATSISINQGVGSVSPVSGGSVNVSPLTTSTYTATATGVAGSAQCSATITVAPLPPPPVNLVWNSWDVVTQTGAPQGVVTAASTTVQASLEFYESTNNFGMAKGLLLPVFNSGTHPTSGFALRAYWANGAGNSQPHVGKSTVGRGSGTSEGNAPLPLGVFDLQTFPPNNNHEIVTAFKIPQDGAYTISNLGVRRVSATSNNARLRVFNAGGVELVNLNATNNQDWVRTATTYTIANATAGQYLYFGVDRNGSTNSSDATEISWTITTPNGPPPPPPPPPTILSFLATPSTIMAGESTTLSWVSTDAEMLSIDQGIGVVTGTSRVVSPTATTTYTLTAVNISGSAVAQTTVNVTPSTSTSTSWNSWDIVTQTGSPQGTVTSGGAPATIEFYESTNNLGIIKGALFSTFTSGNHPDTFNKVRSYWANASGGAYPYAGKSTIARGSDTGETNAVAPLGVFDLMLHPPQNDHNAVAAFKAPQDGSYTISGLGVRRVDTNGTSVRYRIFNAAGTQLALLTATQNRLWVTSPTTYTQNLTAGQYLYFAIDRNGNYDSDATEVKWTVTKN